MTKDYEASLSKLESHYGLGLPAGFKTWALHGYYDVTSDDGTYLWVPEAEWIPLDDIITRDLWRTNLAPGLVPFAFTGAGDNWCWRTKANAKDDEYEVILCWHDEELADRFAPNFPSWFYRCCLDYAACLEQDDAAIEEARNKLKLWSNRLRMIQQPDYANHLLELASASLIEYEDDSIYQIPEIGLITPGEVTDIVATKLGSEFVDGKFDWGSWDWD